jgi:hypothetical protein
MPSFAITAILKSLGVSIADEDIRKIEQFIPQLPGKAQEVIQFNLAKWQTLETRLAAMEDRIAGLGVMVNRSCSLLEKMEELLDGRNLRSADAGTIHTTHSGGSDSRTGSGSRKRNGVIGRSN